MPKILIIIIIIIIIIIVIVIRLMFIRYSTIITTELNCQKSDLFFRIESKLLISGERSRLVVALRLVGFFLRL